MYKNNTRNNNKKNNLIICNNLLATGKCILENHCRYTHLPELSNNSMLDYKKYVPNLNLIPLDTSFNWSIDKIEKDKEALSMLSQCICIVSNKNVENNYDTEKIKNTITNKNRLPIFIKLSNENK
jgi:hypothetical protein